MGSLLSGSLRRAVTVVAGAALLTGVLVAVTAPPAAARTLADFQPASSALVDSATPYQSIADPVSAPLGTTTDDSGVVHTTKVYLTFDLSQLVHHELLSAVLQVPETAVADCSVTTTPQAWLTGTATHPTFAKQPAERTELSGPAQTHGCPDAVPVTWDATAALRGALAAGQDQATIEIRLADTDQTDPSHAITLDPAANLLLDYNILPAQPTGLTVNGKDCAAQPLFIGKSISTLNLGATDTDADDNALAGIEFDWWPVSDPSQRQTVMSSVAISGSPKAAGVPVSDFATDTTYAFQARGVDENTDGTEQELDGPFSDVCTFTTDFVAPATAPTVTSADYPESQPSNLMSSGGVGVPGTFTVSGNGDKDIVAFTTGDDLSQQIPADQPGGTATFRFTPASAGPNSITVHGVDKAGNVGASTTYDFFVNTNDPAVSCTPASPTHIFLGQSVQCVFTDSDPITGYTYTFGDQPAVTVPADANGSATVTLTPTDPDQSPLFRVQAKLANGNLSAANSSVINVDPGDPTVDQSSDVVVFGSPVTFTFHAVLPGSVSFTYSFAGAGGTVPAGADGTATVTLRPSVSGFAELDVVSTTATGIQSGTGSAFVEVDSNAPTVDSTDYPEFSFGGGTGDPGTFTFSPAAPDVVSYTYTFEGGAPVTVPAGADGTATVTLTPTASSEDEPLLVTSTFADGTTSDQTEYDVLANQDPPGVTCDGISLRGQVSAGPADCVFSPVQENVTAYVYSVNNGAPITVAAGPGGTAGITVNADPSQGVLILNVQSENVTGDVSDQASADFDVLSPEQAAARTAQPARVNGGWQSSI